MYVEMRTKLMMRDENKQILAAEYISSRLGQLKQQKKNKFIENLLRFNIGHALCDVMGTSNEKLLRLVSDCLSALCGCINFYENDLANLAIDKIMKTSFFLLRKRSQYEQIVYKMMETVDDILKGAKKHKVDLLTVCDVSRMLEYLNDFEAVGDWEMKPKMCSVRIFKQIVPDISLPMDNKSAEMIRKAFEDHLRCMQQIIEVRGNFDCPITLIAMKYICEISCQAVWFCSMIRNGYDSDVYLVPPPKALHDQLILSLTSTTSKSLQRSVIPHFKQLIPSKDFQLIREAFLTYLNQLYDLEDVDTLELSKTLSMNGYLMFLFQEGKTQVLQKMNWLPSTISRLLSNILTNLAVEEKSLGVDVTPGDVGDFRSSLCEGVMASMESLSPSMNSTAFLTLVYFHHKATKEKIGISFEMIVKRILETAGERWKVPEVKVMWFFMAKLMLRERERPRDLSEAVSQLFDAIKALGVHQCFLDDVEVVKSALGHPLGHDIREKVLEMWIQVHGGVETLWDDFTQDNLMFCLWKLIQNAGERSVEKIQKSLEVLIHQENIEDDMRKFFWQRIPDILAEFDESKTHNLIAILRLFENIGSDDFAGEFGVLCTPNILRIFIGESADSRVKYPIMNLSYKILVFSERHSDPRVAKIFVGKTEVIKEICAQAFNWEMEDLLSGVCLRILTILLVIQKKYNLKSEEVVVMEEMELYSPLKRTQMVSIEAAKFLTMILSESVEKPIVKFEGFSSAAQRNCIVHGIYDTVIALHEMIRPEYWSVLYSCLITVLEFCERRRFTTSLSLCCDSPAHFFLVFIATENQDTSRGFFNFIIHWLTTSIYIVTDNVQYALRCRDKNKRNEFAPKLPFGKTLELLNGYINYLKDDIKVDQSSINSLQLLLEQLI